MAAASAVCAPEPMEANEPGIVFYTSGTTGKPKGIVHAGVAFVVNNYVYAKYHLDLHPDDVLWCTADIGWLTLHIWGIVGALANGISTVVYEGALDHPSPERFYQIVDRYHVNKLFTAPTAIRMLMRHGEALMAPYDLSSLEVVADRRRAAQSRGVALDLREAGARPHLREQHLGPDRALRLPARGRGMAHADEAGLVRAGVPRRRSRHRR